MLKKEHESKPTKLGIQPDKENSIKIKHILREQMDYHLKTLIVQAITGKVTPISENYDDHDEHVVSGDLDFSPREVSLSKSQTGNHVISIVNTEAIDGDPAELHVSSEGRILSHQGSDMKYTASKVPEGIIIRGSTDYDPSEVHHHNILIHNNGTFSQHVHDPVYGASMTITPKGQDHERVKRLLTPS